MNELKNPVRSNPCSEGHQVARLGEAIDALE